MLMVILSSFIPKAYAKRGAIIYSNGEEIENVLNLPNDYQIEAEDGNLYHADLGILHEQFSLFWIPLINYGTEEYVLYTDTKVGNYDFTYTPLTSNDLAQLQQVYNIPTKPELPFWDAWGGKILLGAIIFLFFLYSKD